MKRAQMAAILCLAVVSTAVAVRAAQFPGPALFAVAHDPTQLNRQGPDEGPQYRSAIFFNGPEQKAVAEGYIRQLTEAKVFRRGIVTTVVTLDGFYRAEPEHQDFIRRNPRNPYVLAHDRPKLELLEKDFPELLKSK